MEDIKYPGLTITPEDPEGKYLWELVYYKLDENGEFKKYMMANDEERYIPFKEHWANIYARIQEARQEVLNGTKSPLAYFIERSLMDVSLLSGYTKIPKWRIRQHLRPEKFNKLSPEIIQRYAEAFEVTVEDLLNVK